VSCRLAGAASDLYSLQFDSYGSPDGRSPSGNSEADELSPLGDHELAGSSPDAHDAASRRPDNDAQQSSASIALPLPLVDEGSDGGRGLLLWGHDATPRSGAPKREDESPAGQSPVAHEVEGDRMPERSPTPEAPDVRRDSVLSSDHDDDSWFGDDMDVPVAGYAVLPRYCVCSRGVCVAVVVVKVGKSGSRVSEASCRRCRIWFTVSSCCGAASVASACGHHAGSQRQS
jgi:hypothetical protein